MIKLVVLQQICNFSMKFENNYSDALKLVVLELFSDIQHCDNYGEKECKGMKGLHVEPQSRKTASNTATMWGSLHLHNFILVLTEPPSFFKKKMKKPKNEGAPPPLEI